MHIFLPKFDSEDACHSYFLKLRWPNGVCSPFDPLSKIYSCKGGKYKCRNTGKYFNVRTGTIFSGSRLSLISWVELLNREWENALDPKVIASEFQLSLKSAYLIHQKIKPLLKIEKPKEYVTEQFSLADWLFQIKN